MTASTKRFIQKGITRFYWVPSIASATLAPTAAEVTAGSRLDSQLNTVNGFSFATQFIDATNMASSFTPKELGEDQAAASSLELYEQRGGSALDAIKAVFVKGTAGFIVIFPTGIASSAPAAADICDSWPVTIGACTRQYNAGNELSKYMVDFATTAPPGFDLAVLA